MAGMVFSSSIPYDTFPNSCLVKEQQATIDFSPAGLYTPLVDFGTLDFTAESVTSPELKSPLSPVSPSSLLLPTANSEETDWTSPFGSLSSPVVALPPRKTAHNMIEKRYRNNLNDKISALRDAVPALRVMVHRLKAYNANAATDDDDDDVDAVACISAQRTTVQDIEEDLGGLVPAHNLNKATIFSKATEYITHLERENRALARDNQSLRSKVEGFETQRWT
ncbi:hypothetical protein GGTG_12145 [Gaeumannomyces tritici R3-111a-1]|uniref:BHLH domain-containing protein n=1 Tax=Gaeumannomyces tritici (strain R3-111a-1) TaxID=644352 RepID=J3PF66_GAET3|nr:hypothetical protein GGTG_12145 [Gaeumannomyces tritici R3-111a-1]EJT69968.1 hypothetical protein GGTG_12145 [Gaeumannomyces tritici R3-111a-1]